ncbi:polysaccharide deacetylase family protein [Roseateles toxinivorans]|uniref:polysaccharide deacetylase family protein n=1 Tax=Roseateles toxinivorans TaxID=270368 RepID=UPI001AACC7DF|nr:polysaccharide deacetylase family protein [Roseateles toxinivorans]
MKALMTLLSRKGEEAALTTLLFHKVPESVDPLGPAEPIAAEFEKVLALVKDNFNVIGLNKAVDQLQSGTLDTRSMALTFDDGYLQWDETVAPQLKKFGLPATFFITTEQLDGVRLWSERIVDIVRQLPDSVPWMPPRYQHFTNLQEISQRKRLVKKLVDDLKYQTLEFREAVMTQLEGIIQDPLEVSGVLDEDSVRRFHAEGFEIGAHSHRHPILKAASRAQAEYEITYSKQRLESVIGAEVKGFAYPNGRTGVDYTSEHVEIVKRAGFRYAVSTGGGVATRQSSLFELPRLALWAYSLPRVHFQISCNYFHDVVH